MLSGDFAVFVGEITSAMVEARAGIAVGLNKGHLVTKKDKAVRPASRKGVSVNTHDCMQITISHGAGSIVKLQHQFVELITFLRPPLAVFLNQ